MEYNNLDDGKDHGLIKVSGFFYHKNMRWFKLTCATTTMDYI